MLNNDAVSIVVIALKVRVVYLLNVR